MENSEILRTVRALQLRPSELDALLKRLKQTPFQNLEDVNRWIPKVSWKNMKTKPKTLMLLFLITISFLSQTGSCGIPVR